MVTKQMKENTIYCAKCDEEMKLVLLPKYEYEEGLPVHNVGAYRCNSCNKIFFTEVQAKDLEARTNGQVISYRKRRLFDQESVMLSNYLFSTNNSRNPVAASAFREKITSSNSPITISAVE